MKVVLVEFHDEEVNSLYVLPMRLLFETCEVCTVFACIHDTHSQSLAAGVYFGDLMLLWHFGERRGGKLWVLFLCK